MPSSTTRALVRRSFQALLRSLPPSLAVRIHYLAHHRRLPKLRAPTRFTEKILYRKLNDRDSRLPALVDKVLVKSIVAELIGDEFIIPTIWSGNRLPDRSERTWAAPFIIKSNNGSDQNIIVKRTSEIDWDSIERSCQSWTQTQYGDWCFEWAYSKLTPQIIVEEYLGDLSDYKFFVFDGRVAYIEVGIDVGKTHTRTYFDRSWNRQPFRVGYETHSDEISRPDRLDLAISIAEKLGNGFDFVRVDLYMIGKNIKFGEMTFYPDSGIARFYPDIYDEKLGALWP